MRVLLTALLILLVSAAALPAHGVVQAQESAAAVTVQAEDPVLEAQVRELAAKLRCPTCRALSVQDSPSGMAQEMRSLIRDQLRAGKTPGEVTAYFVERYGEWILLEPKAEGFNWAVWLLPVFLLLGGLAFVLLTARRWVEQGQARAAAIVADGQEEEV
ncbi:MAG: cytochrome c-type biogenesis protein CcmH [Gemmatimonadetes bacterium]|nr:cytochrome c-type biogenesis protein CcmH [Gemmatimonadota bacterium]NIO33021.1 cytochrome c-type biogenesis protein CcmH [Gemmatimonadota bacterium]